MCTVHTYSSEEMVEGEGDGDSKGAHPCTPGSEGEVGCELVRDQGGRQPGRGAGGRHGCTCRAGRRGDGLGDGTQMTVRQRREGGRGSRQQQGRPKATTRSRQ